MWQTLAGVGLEIRYNPQCEAAWARIWGAQVGDTLTLAARGAPTQTIRISNPRDASDFAYTPMIFVAGGHTSLRACITAAGEPADCYTVAAP